MSGGAKDNVIWCSYTSHYYCHHQQAHFTEFYCCNDMVSASCHLSLSVPPFPPANKINILVNIQKTNENCLPKDKPLTRLRLLFSLTVLFQEVEHWMSFYVCWGFFSWQCDVNGSEVIWHWGHLLPLNKLISQMNWYEFWFGRTRIMQKFCDWECVQMPNFLQTLPNK